MNPFVKNEDGGDHDDGCDVDDGHVGDDGKGGEDGVFTNMHEYDDDNYENNTDDDLTMTTMIRQLVVIAVAMS